jgi:hypothetical protein
MHILRLTRHPNAKSLCSEQGRSRDNENANKGTIVVQSVSETRKVIRLTPCHGVRHAKVKKKTCCVLYPLIIAYSGNMSQAAQSV